MAINKKLVNFKKKEDYTKQKEQGNILDTSIVFIDDSKEIVTHDTVFNCNGGSADWNAKEGEEGYIANKPIETIPDTLVYDAKVNGEDWYKLYGCSERGQKGAYQYYKSSYGRSEKATLFPLNKTYRVNIDGTEYICNPQFKHNKMYLSNGVISDTTPQYMVEPNIGDFFIEFSIGSEYHNFTLYVNCDSGDTENRLLSDYTISVCEYVVIKNEFLPISQTTGDSEKEIMSQKAVTDVMNKTNSTISSLNTTVNSFKSTIDNISDWNIQEFEGGIKNKPFGIIIKSVNKLYDALYFGGTKDSSSKYPNMRSNTINITVDTNKYYYIKFNNRANVSKFTSNGSEYVVEFGEKENNNEVYFIFNNNKVDVYFNFSISSLSNLYIYEVTDYEKKIISKEFVESSNSPFSTGTGTNSAQMNACNAKGKYSVASCYNTETNKESEFVCGQFNQLSTNTNYVWGHSAQNLFVVGNGKDASKKHNAFEIRQNGAIYITDTYSKGEYYEKPTYILQDKLQEALTYIKSNWHEIEGQETYIRNKPFGENYQINVDTDVVFDGGYNNMYSTAQIYPIDFTNLIEGEKYSVTLGNKKWECVCYANGIMKSLSDNPDGSYINGTQEIIISYYYDRSRDDVSIQIRYRDNAAYFNSREKVHLTITQIVDNPEIKMLDSKYLPMAQTTGNSETVIMSQKAVTDALVKLWKGSEEEYNALGSHDDNTIYVII